MRLTHEDHRGYAYFKHDTRTYRRSPGGHWSYENGGHWWVIDDLSKIPQIERPPEPPLLDQIVSLPLTWVLVAFGVASLIWGWQNVVWYIVCALLFFQVFMYACGYFLLMIWVEAKGGRRRRNWEDPPDAVKYHMTRSQSR